MKTRTLLVVTLGAGLLGAPGVAAAHEGRARDDRGRADDRLEERVETRIHDDAQLEGLKVDVDHGVVVLRGEVATAIEKARAERMARDAGAERVDNRLEIDKDKAARRIDDRAKARKQQIEERADRQKDAVDRQADVAKERLDRRAGDDDNHPRAADRRTSDGTFSDPVVTAKVKAKIIGDDMLDKSDINVDTDHHGVVTLRGTVPSEPARTRCTPERSTCKAACRRGDGPAPR